MRGILNCGKWLVSSLRAGRLAMYDEDDEDIELKYPVRDEDDADDEDIVDITDTRLANVPASSRAVSAPLPERHQQEPLHWTYEQIRDRGLRLDARTLTLRWLIYLHDVDHICSLRVHFVTMQQHQPETRRFREVLLLDFRHPYTEWSVDSINLFLDMMATAITQDRKYKYARGVRAQASTPRKYRVVTSRLISNKPERRCFPANQNTINAALGPFLDGNLDYRVTEQVVEQTLSDQRAQSHAHERARADENRNQAAIDRRVWSAQIASNGSQMFELQSSVDQAYRNALAVGLGHAPNTDEEKQLATCLATTVTRQDIGVGTEHWFMIQLQRRMTTYRPAVSALHGQPGRLEISDVELVRGLRGEADIRVQLLSQQWHGLQAKTMTYIKDDSYRFACTNKWSPNLLIAATDATFQRFALVWARDTYGAGFTITFGSDSTAEHTAQVILKTTNAEQLINTIIEQLPLALDTPHSRPAGSMMSDTTWTELTSLHYVAAKCLALEIPCVAADRSDAAHDLVVNGHRVQVKATKSGQARRRFFGRQHNTAAGTGRGERRSYRASDFDILMLVLLPDLDHRGADGSIVTYIIPMEQLRKKKLVTYYEEDGRVVVGDPDMQLNLSLYPEWRRFKEAWDIVQRSALGGGESTLR